MMEGRSSENPVPSVALRWIVCNSTSSNAELAILSNISRAWRDVVVDCLIDTVVEDKPTLQPAPSFSRLLVPSWIRQFYMSSSNTVKANHEVSQDNEEEEDHDTYCVAWFHPNGIQSKHVQPANSNPAAVDAVRLLVQWDGFSEAIDILSPFGYSKSFLQVSIVVSLVYSVGGIYE